VRNHGKRDECIGGQRRRQQPNNQRRAAQRRATHQTHANQHPLAPVTVNNHRGHRRQERRGQHLNHPDDPDRRGSAVVKSENSDRDRDGPPTSPGRAKRQLSAP
jgi:hypothetical protein